MSERLAYADGDDENSRLVPQLDARSRQTLLLDRLRTELEAKGGVQAARMDPHVMAVRGSGSGSSRGGDDDGDVHMR